LNRYAIGNKKIRLGEEEDHSVLVSHTLAGMNITVSKYGTQIQQLSLDVGRLMHKVQALTL